MSGPYGLVDFNFGWKDDFYIHFIIQYGTSKVYGNGFRDNIIYFITHCDYPIVFCSLNYDNNIIPGTNAFRDHSPFYIKADTSQNKYFTYTLLGDIPVSANSESYVTMHWLAIGEYDE